MFSHLQSLVLSAYWEAPMGAACLRLGQRVLIRTLLLFCLVQPIPGISSKDGGSGGSWPSDCCLQDPPAQEQTSSLVAEASAKGTSDGQGRNFQTAGSLPLHSMRTARVVEHGGLHPQSHSPSLLTDGVPAAALTDHVLFTSDDKSNGPSCALEGKAEGMGLWSPSSSAPCEKENILKPTSETMLSCVNGKTPAPPDWGNCANRTSPTPSITIGVIWTSSSPSSTCQPMCAVEEANITFFDLLECNPSAGAPYSLKMEISDCIIRPLCSAEDVVKKLPPGAHVLLTTVEMGAWTEAMGPVQVSSKLSLLWSTSRFLAFPKSSADVFPGAHHSQGLSVTQPGPRKPCLLSLCLPWAIATQGPAVVENSVTQQLPETDTWASPYLGFKVQMASEGPLCLVTDFGDSPGVQMKIQNTSEEITVTAYHQYRKGMAHSSIIKNMEGKP
nr:polycystic kidney disease protein 1-like 1 [Loxodonta africana]